MRLFLLSKAAWFFARCDDEQTCELAVNEVIFFTELLKLLGNGCQLLISRGRSSDILLYSGWPLHGQGNTESYNREGPEGHSCGFSGSIMLREN